MGQITTTSPTWIKAVTGRCNYAKPSPMLAYSLSPPAPCRPGKKSRREFTPHTDVRAMALKHARRAKGQKRSPTRFCHLWPGGPPSRKYKNSGPTTSRTPPDQSATTSPSKASSKHSEPHTHHSEAHTKTRKRNEQIHTTLARNHPGIPNVRKRPMASQHRNAKRSKHLRRKPGSRANYPVRH